MKKNNAVFIFIISVLFLAGAVFASKQKMQSDATQKISSDLVEDLNVAVSRELAKVNIHPTAKPNVFLDRLPPVLTDAHWGGKQTVCKDGGYDLLPYVGQAVTLETYPTDELYNNTEPLNVGVVWNNDQIICIFRTVSAQSEMAPGIFSVRENPLIQMKR